MLKILQQKQFDEHVVGNSAEVTIAMGNFDTNALVLLTILGRSSYDAVQSGAPASSRSWEPNGDNPV